MKKRESNQSVIIDFIGEDGRGQRQLFQDPLEVVTTDKISDVRPALLRIQEAVDQGLYAAGYVSYEAAPAFDAALEVRADSGMPLLWFGLYEAPLREDKRRLGTNITLAEAYSVSAWQPAIDQEEYEAAIRSIHAAIAAGETYQVNYTLRFQAEFQGDAGSYYEDLRQNQQASYAAFLNMGRHQIVSLSPELFFRWDGTTLLTKPMKGTKRRGRWSEEDRCLRDDLLTSEKDRAENLMIVDLLRNDLGRIAKTGTVQVPRLFDVEKYPTVYQMTSTVQAETSPGATLEDIFSALFPCGSITGAPKVSTMRLITKLENAPRDAYCGAIGYMAPGRIAEFNVAIRTLVIDQAVQRAVYGSGGGITWDSTATGEYDESLLKTKVLTERPADFDLLETMKLEAGELLLLERHLDRLQASAHYFDFSYDQDTVQEKLRQLAASNTSGSWRIRLLLSRDGRLHLEKAPLETDANTEEPKRFRLSAQPVPCENRFLYHKTTNRHVYENCKTDRRDVDDVLLWNEAGEITEFTIGNIVIEWGGRCWTPPLECGLLAGTMRADLLAKGEIEEKILSKKDLQEAEQIWLINSVRGWVPMCWVDA